jgi:hypothetical protein
MRKTSIVDTEISLTEAARLISKTPKWVTELVKAGRIKRPERGRYQPVDVVKGYVTSILESRKQTNKVPPWRKCSRRARARSRCGWRGKSAKSSRPKRH